MRYHRVIFTMFSISMFIVFGQWSAQAVGQVNVDVGGVHVHVGNGPPPPPPEEVVVLTRGPVHEAFAQPVVFTEDTAFTISRRPPEPIDEIVPEMKPEGDHIVWIPGYWSWDSDRNDFIWVSGCWRAVPPNTSWVPGYWAQSTRGYQWTSGFWAASGAQEIEYLPAPPTTLEAGPRGVGSADSIWVPGCWVRHEGRYAWRAGFWEQARPDWVWVPSQYISTPRGWIYVEGYWDYPLSRRGVAYLPVYCSSSVYERRGFRYSPEFVLDLDGLMLNLFISPERHHYYFGDYYGDEYSREGYYSWYDVPSHHDWYDPIYTHDQWQNRGDRNWATNQRAGYDQRRTNSSLRPARTYDAMTAQVSRMPAQDRRQVQMARPMREAAASNTTPFKYNTLDAKTRETTATQARDVHAYKDKRSQWESTKAFASPGQPVRTNVVEPAHNTPAAVHNSAVVEPVRTSPAVHTPPAVEPAHTPAATHTPLPAPPAAQPQTPGHSFVAREQPAGQDIQAHKVAIPSPPTTVREPVRSKELTPPARPNHPAPDPSVRPNPVKSDAPGHSSDKGDSDKPDSRK